MKPRIVLSPAEVVYLMLEARVYPDNPTVAKAAKEAKALARTLAAEAKPGRAERKRRASNAESVRD